MMSHEELIGVLHSQVVDAQRELLDMASAFDLADGVITSTLAAETPEILRSAAKLCGLLMELVEKYSAMGLS